MTPRQPVTNSRSWPKVSSLCKVVMLCDPLDNGCLVPNGINLLVRYNVVGLMQRSKRRWHRCNDQHWRRLWIDTRIWEYYRMNWLETQICPCYAGWPRRMPLSNQSQKSNFTWTAHSSGAALTHPRPKYLWWVKRPHASASAGSSHVNLASVAFRRNVRAEGTTN